MLARKQGKRTVYQVERCLQMSSMPYHIQTFCMLQVPPESDQATPVVVAYLRVNVVWTFVSTKCNPRMQPAMLFNQHVQGCKVGRPLGPESVPRKCSSLPWIHSCNGNADLPLSRIDQQPLALGLDFKMHRGTLPWGLGEPKKDRAVQS